MSLKCNYPGCKKTFKVDCPVSEIYEHLDKAHNVDVFNPISLLKASLLNSLEKSRTENE